MTIEDLALIVEPLRFANPRARVLFTQFGAPPSEISISSIVATARFRRAVNAVARFAWSAE